MSEADKADNSPENQNERTEFVCSLEKSENVDNNIINQNFNDDYYDSNEGDNEKTEVPFSELLEIHGKQFVWGFKYGEENRRLAERNMKKSSINDNNSHHHQTAPPPPPPSSSSSSSSSSTTTTESQTESDDEPKPSCSKTISENDHKTPHSTRRQQPSGIKRPYGKSNDEPITENRRVPIALRRCLDNLECWKFMISREEASINLRNSRLFNDFNTVTPRMRAILLDWLMEVSEVYHLRRVTYYCSVDYFDRFLTIRPNIPKNALQLVGVTCLYIAAKVEEIYPPNLKEFAYVCDGACRANDIINCELLILNSLGWEANLTTPSDWLNIYLQILYRYEKFMNNPKFTIQQSIQEFMYPQYSAYKFIKASHLMDLFTLDPTYLKYRYSTIAASAIYFLFGKDITCFITGIPWNELKSCIEYMSVFNKILNESNDPRLKYVTGINNNSNDLLNGITINRKLINDTITTTYNNKGISVNDGYQLQTHVANMQYFEQASILRLAILTGRYENLIKFHKNDNDNNNDNNVNNDDNTLSPSKKGCTSSSSSSNINNDNKSKKDGNDNTDGSDYDSDDNDDDSDDDVDDDDEVYNNSKDDRFCEELAQKELELINETLKKSQLNNGGGHYDRNNDDDDNKKDDYDNCTNDINDKNDDKSNVISNEDDNKQGKEDEVLLSIEKILELIVKHENDKEQ